MASGSDEYTPHVQDPELLEAFRYISQVPGKDIRGKLIDAFQRWFKIPEDKVTSIKQLVAELHNASLLVDDIEDNSQLRRGIPVAHAIYGVPTTINTANYVYFLALERCHRLGNPAAMNVFVLELLNLHRGQGQDILWRDNLRCPTEEEYERMVLDKTGGLFRLAVGLMQAFCGEDNPCKNQDFTPLVDKLALYFQIRDDLVNLASSDYHISKSFCEDLTEGKFSFPIIHSIRSRPDDTQILNILKKRTESVSIKQYAVEHMEKCGSFAYTQARLQQLHGEVLESIQAMGGHEELTKIVQYLHQQVLEVKGKASAPTPAGDTDAADLDKEAKAISAAKAVPAPAVPAAPAATSGGYPAAKVQVVDSLES